MATRNLTALFQRARSASQQNRPPPHVGADYGSTATAYDMRPLDGTAAAGSGLPPIYVDRVDEINAEIETIREKSTRHRGAGAGCAGCVGRGGGEGGAGAARGAEGAR